MFILTISLIIQLTIGSFVPKHGDLLFQQIDCGDICDAIEQVTSGYNGAHLSHVGLVIEKNDRFYVIEAVQDGVILRPLDEFLNRSKDASGNPKVLAGRLKPQYSHLIAGAVKEAERYLGKPYDDIFIFGNDSYYCSELIYLAFKSANGNIDFFNPEPMTFKKPGSGSFFPAWQKYYQDRGSDIPEGMPGINPGLISRSEKIEIIHIYGIIKGLRSK